MHYCTPNFSTNGKKYANIQISLEVVIKKKTVIHKVGEKLIGLNSQEMEEFKRKFQKDYGFFQDNYLNCERRRKEYAEGIDQIISSKAHQEEQKTKQVEENNESKQKNKDELKRNMQIYEDSSVYLGHCLFFFLPQTQLITEVTQCYLMSTNLVDTSGTYVLPCTAYL